MSLLPVAPPPGYYRNGMNYSAKGRWKEGNLMRFVGGRPRAIGGWTRRSDVDDNPIDVLFPDASLEAARAIFSWRDNLGARYIAVGTTLHLYIIASSGTVTDVTPSSGFTPGDKDASLVSGFGVGSYGSGPYGTPRVGAGLLSDPVGQWSFDAWGQDLLSAGPLGDTTSLFSWEPGDPAAVVVPNAPEDFADFLVTNERIVMCIGTGDNRRGITWSTREDRETWTPSPTNQAGEVTLAGSGDLLAGIKLTNNQILVLGEGDAHLGIYLGPPYVYGFQPLAEECGIYCANAVAASSDGSGYWWGSNGFFKYDGSVKLLDCEVIDFLDDDLNEDSASKISSFTLSRYNEIWWLYQSASSSSEVDSYVSYNYLTGTWTTGRIDRTTGMDKGVTRDAVMVASDGAVYNHELDGVGTGDVIPFVRTGPIEFGNGDQKVNIDFVIPAIDNLGAATIYFHCRDFPNGTTRTLGPHTLLNPTPTYAEGREIELEVRAVNPGIVIGDFRMNVIPGDER